MTRPRSCATGRAALSHPGFRDHHSFKDGHLRSATTPINTSTTNKTGARL